MLTLVPGVEFLNEFDLSALVFPPEGRSPWVVVALQSDSKASTDDLSAVHADAMRQLVKAWG